eukprot:gene9680-48195_t
MAVRIGADAGEEASGIISHLHKGGVGPSLRYGSSAAEEECVGGAARVTSVDVQRDDVPSPVAPYQEDAKKKWAIDHKHPAPFLWLADQIVASWRFISADISATTSGCWDDTSLRSDGSLERHPTGMLHIADWYGTFCQLAGIEEALIGRKWEDNALVLHPAQPSLLTSVERRAHGLALFESRDGIAADMAAEHAALLDALRRREERERCQRQRPDPRPP